jgi:uncharacterized membrane protein
MFLQSWLATDGLGYLFVLLVVGALLALGFGRPRRRRSPRAEEILKRRFARGQITKEEYEKQLEELRR